MIRLFIAPEFHGEKVYLSECSVCGGLYPSSDPRNYLRYDIDGETPRVEWGILGKICSACLSLSDDTVRQYLKIRAKREQNQADILRTFVNNLCNITHGCDECSVPASQHIEELKKWGIPSYEEIADSYTTAADFYVFERAASKVAIKPNVFRGYVYLLGSPEGYCKIGRTVNLTSRLLAIGLQLPFKIELLHSIQVSDPVRAERFLHSKFAHCRANGEWFLLSVDDINWIKSRTSLEGLY